MIEIKEQEQFDNLTNKVLTNETIFIYPLKSGENYKLNKVLKIGNNVSIKGENSPSIINSAGLENMIEITGTEKENLQYIKIEGIILNGNETAQDCIKVEYGQVKIIDCSTKNVNNNGIELIKCTNCVLQKNHSVGIHLDTCKNCIIVNNTSEQCKYSGISLNDSVNNIITGNICCNNKMDGIFLGNRSCSNTLIGNYCGEGSNGIGVNDSRNNTFIGNNCNSNRKEGILLKNSSCESILNSNICSYNQQNGISIDTLSKSIVFNNISQDNISSNMKSDNNLNADISKTNCI